MLSKLDTSFEPDSFVVFLCCDNNDTFVLDIFRPGHHLTLDLFDVVSVLQVECFNAGVSKVQEFLSA